MNKLKYGLMLLATFFFFGKAIAQSAPFDKGTYVDCDGNGIGLPLEYDDSGEPASYYLYPDIIASGPSGLCWMTEQCSTDGGGCYPAKLYIPVPLGSGVFIFMFFVLGYGGVLYSRRKPARA